LVLSQHCIILQVQHFLFMLMMIDDNLFYPQMWYLLGNKPTNN